MDPGAWEGTVGQRAEAAHCDVGRPMVRGRYGVQGRGREITVGSQIHHLSHSHSCQSHSLTLTALKASLGRYRPCSQLTAGQMMRRSLRGFGQCASEPLGSVSEDQRVDHDCPGRPRLRPSHPGPPALLLRPEIVPRLGSGPSAPSTCLATRTAYQPPSLALRHAFILLSPFGPPAES